MEPQQQPESSGDDGGRDQKGEKKQKQSQRGLLRAMGIARRFGEVFRDVPNSVFELVITTLSDYLRAMVTNRNKNPWTNQNIFSQIEVATASLMAGRDFMLAHYPEATAHFVAVIQELNLSAQDTLNGLRLAFMFRSPTAGPPKVRKPPTL